MQRSVMSATEFVRDSTLGLTQGVRNFGAFALALTEHRLGFQSAPHVHERAGVNFVIDGAYAERLGRHRLVALRGSWLAKPAWQEHANDFRESGARCLLVEIAPGHEQSVREIMDLFDQPRHRETVVDIRELHVLAAALHSNNFSETCDLEERTFALLLHVARKVRLRAEHQPNAWLRRIREMIHETRTNALSLTALSSARAAAPGTCVTRVSTSVRLLDRHVSAPASRRARECVVAGLAPFHQRGRTDGRFLRSPAPRSRFSSRHGGYPECISASSRGAISRSSAPDAAGMMHRSVASRLSRSVLVRARTASCSAKGPRSSWQSDENPSHRSPAILDKPSRRPGRSRSRRASSARLQERWEVP